MARNRKTSLRDFQLSLGERLRTASTRTAVSSRLGFQVGADNWFVPLHHVSEVIPVPSPVTVPLTHPWFRGVANVRGNLFSVIDFSAFQGADAIPSGMERRVILVSDRLIGGAGLVVSRMLGLRNPDQFSPLPRPEDAPPWLGGVYTAAGGVRWLELDLPQLVKQTRFLEVGL